MPDLILRPTSFRPRFSVVDMHGHSFANIARFLEIAKSYARRDPKFHLFGNGSTTEAYQSMATTGIVVRVLKNVSANPRGVVAANNYAIETASQFADGLVPTGTIHADFKHNETELDRLYQAGIKGITLNSCWQGFRINDPRIRSLLVKMTEYSMFLILHTGIDSQPANKDIETLPEHILEVRDKVPGLKINAAHLGSNLRFEKVLQYGRNPGLLLDLAYLMEYCLTYEAVTIEQILEIINHIGVDWIAYGSDYPWADPGTQLEFWQNLITKNFSTEAWKKISGDNARKFFGL